jgi:tetratricopeptide (TPR) repeat protein
MTANLSQSVHMAVKGLVAAAALVLAAHAHAQQPPASDGEYRKALDAMLADLGNPEASFDFAKVAVSSGDARGAIAAFERILRLNPTLANIELELGVLYLRSGNAELGRYHIRKALQAANMPAVVRRRAEGYLATAAVESSRHAFRFDASVSARYDSNANAGPGSDVVLLGGTPVLLGSGTATEDASAEALAAFTHDYSLSENSSLESRLLLFASRYDELSNLDLSLGTLETGPLFRLGDATAPAFLRPFVSGGYYLLDGDEYFTSYGAGFEARKFTRGSNVLSLRVQYEEQDFEDRPGRFVSDRSGGYFQVNASFARQFGAHVQFVAEVLAETANADAHYQRYDRYGGGLGLTWFSSPGPRGRWSIGLSGRVREAQYDSPDAQIDPLREREDTRIDARLTLNVPLSRSLALTVSGIYADNDSNLPNYSYDNTGGSVGLNVRF